MIQRRTERLLLRDFVEGDWTAVYAYQTHPDYLRFYHWDHRLPDEVQEFVKMFVRRQRAQPRTHFQLAIVLPESGQIIGNCGIRQRHVESYEAEIGYELDPAYWGNGYATEAARVMVHFGFTELKLHRVTATCIAENEASARVLRKLGMQQEGRLREKEWFKGRWWDVLLFSVLKQEWERKK